MRYESVAEAYRLEAASARLELIDRLARLSLPSERFNLTGR